MVLFSLTLLLSPWLEVNQNLNQKDGEKTKGEKVKWWQGKGHTAWRNLEGSQGRSLDIEAQVIEFYGQYNLHTYGARRIKAYISNVLAKKLFFTYQLLSGIKMTHTKIKLQTPLQKHKTHHTRPFDFMLEFESSSMYGLHLT